MDLSLYHTVLSFTKSFLKLTVVLLREKESDVSSVSYKGPDQAGPESRGERRESFGKEGSGPSNGPYRRMKTVHLRTD